MQIVHVKTQKNDRKFISPRMGSIIVIPELDGQKAIEEPTCWWCPCSTCLESIFCNGFFKLKGGEPALISVQPKPVVSLQTRMIRNSTSSFTSTLTKSPPPSSPPAWRKKVKWGDNSLRLSPTWHDHSGATGWCKGRLTISSCNCDGSQAPQECGWDSVGMVEGVKGGSGTLRVEGVWKTGNGRMGTGHSFAPSQ